MSTESVDKDLIEQTKQQIRSLVSEIARLTKADVAPLEFYSEFLTRVVQALAAIGGAVWVPGEGGRLELQYQINLSKTGLLEDQTSQIRHGRLLHQVVSRGEGMLVTPQSGAGDDDEAANPTEFLLVLAPLKADQETRGVVEVFQRPGTRPNVQRGYLRFLLQMCELAGDFLKTRELRHFTDRQALWTQLEQFTRAAHLSLDPAETAFTISNEGRRLIECDRVSVAIRRGSSCKIEAISGQDTFDKRSNTVVLLNRLATAVVRTGDELWYTGDTDDLAPQVEDALQEYIDDAHSKTVAVIPLKRPLPVQEEHDDRESIGALIVEQIEDARVSDAFHQRVQVVAEHSASALANSLEHHGLFLMPLWRTLGKLSWIVRARTLPKTLAVLGAITALIVALVVVPWNFEVEGDGTLQPQVRQRVFVDIGGEVTDVLVRHGQTVQADQELLRLRNSELDLRLHKAVGDLAETGKNIATFQNILVQPGLDQDKRTQVGGELEAALKRRESLERQIAILREQEERLTVRAPVTGQVITWDLHRELLGRTVEPGQVLMEIADPTGNWELEVLMPDDRMGHVATAARELAEEGNLSVRYHLATDPGVERQGLVQEMHLSAEVRGEQGNTVLMKVDIDRSTLPEQLRPGATVRARVYCGRRSLGFVLFHDLVAFIQSRVLFRI